MSGAGRDLYHATPFIACCRIASPCPPATGITFLCAMRAEKMSKSARSSRWRRCATGFLSAAEVGPRSASARRPLIASRLRSMTFCCDGVALGAWRAIRSMRSRSPFNVATFCHRIHESLRV